MPMPIAGSDSGTRRGVAVKSPSLCELSLWLLTIDFPFRMTQHGFQCPCQLGSGAFQFRAVCQCKLTQYHPTRRRQPDAYFALILFSRMSRYRACLLQAVYQFHRAVMLNEQSRGEFPDRRFGVVRKTMYRKQQLMLPGLKAMLFRRGFAEMKEVPDSACGTRPGPGIARERDPSPLFISYYDVLWNW